MCSPRKLLNPLAGSASSSGRSLVPSNASRRALTCCQSMISEGSGVSLPSSSSLLRVRRCWRCLCMPMGVSVKGVRPIPKWRLCLLGEGPHNAVKWRSVRVGILKVVAIGTSNKALISLFGCSSFGLSQWSFFRCRYCSGLFEFLFSFI